MFQSLRTYLTLLGYMGLPGLQSLFCSRGYEAPASCAIESCRWEARFSCSWVPCVSASAQPLSGPLLACPGALRHDLLCCPATSYSMSCLFWVVNKHSECALFGLCFPVLLGCPAVWCSEVLVRLACAQETHAAPGRRVGEAGLPACLPACLGLPLPCGTLHPVVWDPEFLVGRHRVGPAAPLGARPHLARNGKCSPRLRLCRSTH